MAGYRTYFGAFRSPTSAGSQAVTGLGFAPKAIFHWSVNTAQAVPEFNDFNYWSCGLTDGTSHLAATSISFDNAGTSDLSQGIDTSAFVLAENTAGGTQHRATLTSLDSDGFTLNWTNIFASEPRWYNFIAIGGDDVEVSVGVLNSLTATGAQSLTGLAFRPTGAIFIPIQNSGTTESSLTYPAIGYTDGANQGASYVFSQEGAASAVTKRYQRVDKCVALGAVSDGSVLAEAAITSFNDDGLTLNWTTAPASAIRLFYLTFSALPFKVGALTQPAASEAQSVTVEFEPGVVLLQTVNAAASTSVQNGNDLSLGAASPDRQYAMWLADKHGADPMESARYYSQTVAFASASVNATGTASTLLSTGTVRVETIKSINYFDPDGFTVDWSADGTQRQIIWAAFGGYSNRNLITGKDHEVSGCDNVVSGRSNRVTGNHNQAHGENATVIGHRSVLFNLDGVPRTLVGDDKFEVYADDVTLPVAAHASSHSAGGSDPINVEDLDANSGTDGDVLTLVGGLPSWEAPTGGGGSPGGSPSGDPADIILTASYASRPAAGSEGRLFLPNNGFYIERDSGSAWVPWGPIFPMTPPVDGDFAWVNQGSATVSTTNGGIALVAQAAAGNSMKIRKKAAPATPYTITIAFIPNMIGTPGTDAPGMGLLFRQSSDGKIVTCNTVITSAVANAASTVVRTQKYNSATSFSANYVSYAYQPGGIVWLRITDNGVNRISSISFDGVNFLDFHTVGRTDFLTADEVGFWVDANNANNAVVMQLLSWKEA